MGENGRGVWSVFRLMCQYMRDTPQLGGGRTLEVRRRHHYRVLLTTQYVTEL